MIEIPVVSAHALQRLILLVAMSSVTWSGTGVAQNASSTYPSRPVTVVLPFPAGGPVDNEARLYTQKLSQDFARPFVLDFKAGAGSTIGVAYVAKAPPDGYTLLVTNSSFSIAPAFYPNLPYDPIRDLAPISMMSKRTTLLLASPNLPFSTVPEYIAYVRSHPNQINMATVGAGSALHLAGAWLHSATDTKVTFVHYKGAGPVYLDLIAGRVQVAFITLSSAMPYIKSGKLKLLGLASLERSSLLPDIPTIAEQVSPGFEYSSWMGFSAPGATPADFINKLSSQMARIARSPELVQKLAPEGTILIGSTPEQFRQHIVTETARWRKLVQDTGMKLEE